MIPSIQHEDMYAGYWDVFIMVRFLNSVQRFDSMMSEVWMNCIMKTSRSVIFEYQAEFQDN
ncbi:MAG: hypothetical protein ACD_6C00308G0002 [uncultured bacterium]|nr:MAG: hypothetical protein ACD_6C00308G0002 [uncultured bacterium]HCB29642.1 hypothetical protein [Acinetobacter lwoffii]